MCFTTAVAETNFREAEYFSIGKTKEDYYRGFYPYLLYERTAIDIKNVCEIGVFELFIIVKGRGMWSIEIIYLK